MIGIHSPRRRMHSRVQIVAYEIRGIYEIIPVNLLANAIWKREALVGQKLGTLKRIQKCLKYNPIYEKWLFRYESSSNINSLDSSWVPCLWARRVNTYRRIH